MAYTTDDLAFALDFVLGGHPWTITGAVIAAGSFAGTLNDIALDIGGDWASNMNAFQNEDSTLTKCTVTQLVSNEKGIAAFSVTGVEVGASLPNNVAMCISLHTAHAGRSGRGRMYLGALVSGGLVTGDPNQWEASYTAAIKAAFDGFISDLAATHSPSGGEYELAVHSRTDATLYPVTAATIDVLVDTQRRRVRD